MSTFPTNAWTSYGVGWPKSIDANATASAVGNKEQFLGEITIIDPTDTPTFAMLQKEQWSAPYQEWPIDTLAATSTAASFEAWEFEATSLSGRTRYNNITQAFHRGLLVSRRQQQMSQRGVTQGVSDEYRYQLGKKILELNRDINARIVANGSAVASATGATGTASGSVMGAFRAFPMLVTNVSGAFATGSFLNLHRKLDELGANPDTLLVSSGVKSDISQAILGLSPTTANASAMRRFTQPATDKSFSAIIDILEDDFGQVSIVRDRWLPTASAVASTSATALNGTAAAYFLFDKSMVKIGTFQPPMHKPLPPNGDYERGFIVAEVSLKVLHPSACAAGTNVTQTAI